jgi:alpha-D-ribose 1-methylphosphonate 5-triphosphate synthase subunit PhnG
MVPGKIHHPMPSPTDLHGQPTRRQRWLSILARAPSHRLEALWSGCGATPRYSLLRRPEIGLVMVKGRISGSGAGFCAGEMTATRAAVRLPTGEIGFGYVGGRSPRHAEIIAIVDALGQRAEWQARLEAQIVAPLVAEAEARQRQVASRAAATKVEFFTVAREAGP